jgi:carbonic anhydrase
MNQSPINIDSTANAHLSPLQTHYIDGPVTLTNNGHTIQAANRLTPATPSLWISKPGRYSSSISMRRAKTPCTARNTRWRCIWYKMPGELTVVAVMFDKGAANPELDKLWSVMPQQAEQNVSIKKDLNLNKLLPKTKPTGALAVH